MRGPLPSPPWLYLEVAAAVLTVAAWLVMAGFWFTALPLTRWVRISGIVVCLSAAAATVLPAAGRHAAPWAAVNHLVGGAAFLGFAGALSVMFRQIAARRRTAPEPPGADSR